MPWLSQELYPLPQEDIVSFAFGNTDYDNNKPVSIIFWDAGSLLT